MTTTQKTNKQLADEIREKFTPLVFTCSCKGEHENCRWTLEENIGGVWQVRDTVHRIAEYLENN